MRPIDADKFEEFIRKNCSDSLVDLWCELVRRQPTIEAVPVVHGEWIKEMGAFFPRYICSACREKYSAEWYRHCPSCGAKMKGGAE